MNFWQSITDFNPKKNKVFDFENSQGVSVFFSSRLEQAKSNSKSLNIFLAKSNILAIVAKPYDDWPEANNIPSAISV